LEPEARPMQVGHSERLIEVVLDGKPHEWRLECIVGGRGLRPDVGELCVGIAGTDQSLRLLSQSLTVPLTDGDWLAYAAAQRERLEQANRLARQSAGEEESRYWSMRHELARKLLAARTPAEAPQYDIDRFINDKLAA